MPVPLYSTGDGVWQKVQAVIGLKVRYDRQLDRTAVQMSSSLSAEQVLVTPVRLVNSVVACTGQPPAIGP